MADPLTTWGAAAERFTDRDAWAAARKAGLGASSVASALGLGRFGGPWDVWCSIHAPEALLEPGAGKASDFRRGHHYERAALCLYAEDKGYDVDPCDPAQAWMPERPWARCSPDAVVMVDSKPAGLAEVKTCRFGDSVDGWPDLVTGITYGLPRVDWVVQCIWQAVVTGAPWVDLVVVGPFFQPPTVVRIQPDAAERERLLAAAAAWWEEHDAKTPPPRDGSETCRRYYAAQPHGPAMREDLLGLLEDWSSAKRALADAKAAEAEAKNAVAEAIGTDCGLTDGVRTAKYDKRGALRLRGGE